MATENYSIGLLYEVNEEGNYCTVTGIGTCTDTEIVIPETYEGYTVREIGQEAFRGYTNLTSITIPNSVTSIGNSAFYRCSKLTNVTIGNSVTSIGGEAFRNCSSLTSITIGNSVTSIGDKAFYYCSNLTSITIGTGVTSIGNHAFYDTAYYKNESNWENGVIYIGKYLIEAKETISGAYTIKSETKLIADNAFEDCTNLTSVTIPNSVTSIGSWGFSGCYRLDDITIPNSVVEISSRAFHNCQSLTNVTIPDSVTSINSFAFNNCSKLTSVTIPNSVTSIDGYAFSGCSSLTSITIPKSVTSIGDKAFEDCTRLQKITLDHPVNSLEGAVWGAPEDVQVAWIGATFSENVEFYFLNNPKRPHPAQGAISFGVQPITDSDDNVVSTGDDGILYVTNATGPHAVGTFDADKIRFKDALAFTENFGKYKPNGVRTTYDETKGMSVQEFITSALTNYSIKSYPKLTASISPVSARYGTTQGYNLTLTFTQGQYSTGAISTCKVTALSITGGSGLPDDYEVYINELSRDGSTTIPLNAFSLTSKLSYKCIVGYTADTLGGVEGVCISNGTAEGTATISCYEGWIICPTTNTYSTTESDIEYIINQAAKKTTNDNRVDSYNISTGWKNLYVLVPTSTGITKWNPIDVTNNSPLGNLYSENVLVRGGDSYYNASTRIEYTFFSVSNAAEYNACTINFNWS